MKLSLWRTLPVVAAMAVVALLLRIADADDTAEPIPTVAPTSAPSVAPSASPGASSCPYGKGTSTRSATGRPPP